MRINLILLSVLLAIAQSLMSSAKDSGAASSTPSGGEIAQSLKSSARDSGAAHSTTSGREIAQSLKSSAKDSRAAHSTTSGDSSSSAPVLNDELDRMVSEHMKLGRVLTGLYLQMMLSEIRMRGEDVLAAEWNLEGRQIIYDLVRFDYEQLSQQILKIETMASGKLKLHFGPDSFSAVNFSKYLKENNAKRALQSFEGYLNSTDYGSFEELKNALERCCYLIDLQSFPAKLKIAVEPAYSQEALNSPNFLKIEQLHLNPSPGMYSALASLSEANFSIIYDDLTDDWLQNMLKYGALENRLEVVLTNLKGYLVQLSIVNEHLKSIVSKSSRLDLDGDRWNQLIGKAERCTAAAPEKPQMELLGSEVSRMQSALDSMKNREEVLRVIRSAYEILKSASESDYRTKFESMDRALISSTLQNAIPDFQKFVMNQSVINQSIGAHECQQLIDELRTPLTLIRTVTEQRTQIALLKSSLQKLNSIEVSPPMWFPTLKSMRRFSSDIRDCLLGVIDVISVFGKMHQLFVNEPAFQAILNHGDYVKKLVIQSADSGALDKSSKEIWSTHWDTFKGNLTAFRDINSDAIQNISTTDESSLMEMCEKYRTMSQSTSFSGLQQLDKLTILWNSMKHLTSKNDTEVQMVSDAFRQLQYPIMTVDWKSIGLKFQEITKKFQRVDKALKVFLGKDVSKNEKSRAPPRFFAKYAKPMEKTESDTTSSPSLERFQMKVLGFFVTAIVCALSIFVIRRNGWDRLLEPF